MCAIAHTKQCPIIAAGAAAGVAQIAKEAYTIASSHVGENFLLSALPSHIRDRWLPHLESVEMGLGEVVYESGATLSHVYFPTTAIVSLLYVLANGASAEIAVVGNEGIVGVSMFMGGKSTPSRAVVQSAGQGIQLKAQILEEEFNRAGPAQHLLLRYTQALITQMSKPRFAIATILWINNCADGSC